MIERRLARAGLALALAGLVGGCAGTPPQPSPVRLPLQAPLTDITAGGGEWPAAEWWKRYHDATLDRLIDLALESSPTLGTARARFDSARQSVKVAGADSGARVSGVADANHERFSNNGVFKPALLGFSQYSLYDLGLQASYTFDWWDKQRDTVEAAVDEAHASQAERSAAALSLASSIADAYYGWQADQSRLALAREREATVLRERAIMAARIRAGLESADEIQHADAAVAAAREHIADLEGSAAQHVVALAALTGAPAAQLPALELKPLPAVSAGLPDHVAIDLIARRPDITASRWRVEAAQKGRDAARAEFFPDISVNALLGVQSINLGSLVQYGSRVPQVTAAVHLPIFDAGRLKARYGAAESAIDSAVASYQATLVDAARDVATQAAARAQIGRERGQRALEVEAAQRLSQSASSRVRQGVTDLRSALDAAESLIAERDALLQLDAAALSTDIGLQRALGGGYDSTSTTQ
jgi:multidrug efflux system outer membrane protein